MAYAIVVEDGTGLSTANSYISASDANDKLAEMYLLMGIAAAPTLADIDCTNGTYYLDQMYGGQWKGTRSNQTQALDWPRTGVTDDDDYDYDSDELPEPLLRAVSLAGYYAQTEGGELIENQDTPGSIKKTKKKVAVLEKEIEYAGANPQQKKYALIEKYIRELIESTSVAIRGS